MSVCHFPGFLWDGKRWRAALYSNMINIEKRGLVIGTLMFALLPYQFFAPRRSGLPTNLLDLNFYIIQKCRQHLPLGFNAAVINHRNITQRKWGICGGSWEKNHSLTDRADKPLPQIWNGRSIPPPIIAVGPLLNIPSPCKSYLSHRTSSLPDDTVNESFDTLKWST